jgi:hypothetical protein
MHHFSGSPHEERRITATPRVAVGIAGFTRFRLVCIALVFTLLNTVQQQKDRLPGGVVSGCPKPHINGEYPMGKEMEAA